MSKIADEEINKTITLARIKFADQEKAQLTQELTSILDYVAECEKAPTEKIEPIEQISNLKNISRDDEIGPSLALEKVLQNAPEKDGNFFKVKKIFE